MKLRLTIKRFDNKVFVLEYSGVRDFIQREYHEKGHVEVKLYKNYKGPAKELLQEFNCSCTPYVHSFYGVDSYHISQEDRDQEQFKEDGEDLEDPIGYL